jgi:phenylalanyl-tRNA synthetase beta chain
MIEMMTFELVDEGSLYSNFGRSHAGMLKVQDPKSIDHSVLRDALIPTLLSSLSSNARSEYPQRVFEIGRVFARSAEGVTESWHLGCLVAHSQSSFSEAKMYLEAACRTLSGKDLSTEPAEHWAFSEGRCASASDGGHALGFVGELRPEAISACGLGVPVSGFEIDLSRLYERLK